MWLPNNILKTHICQKASVILYKYLDSALCNSTSSHFLLLCLSSDYGFNKLIFRLQEIPLLLHSYELLPPWQPATFLKSCLGLILAFPLPSNLSAVCFSRQIPPISRRDFKNVTVSGFASVVLSF